MSWGYYSGDVIDYETNPDSTKYPKPDIFSDARASAIMIGLEGRSYFRLRVSGIDAEDGVYGVHLHQGTCNAMNFDEAGKHYNVSWNNSTTLDDLISNETEVWLDLDVNSDGYARSTATVDFIPEGNRSIVLHADPTAEVTGLAGPRLACMPFTIKKTS
jgi:Cu/Zn superoxide dismutase